MVSPWPWLNKHLDYVIWIGRKEITLPDFVSPDPNEILIKGQIGTLVGVTLITDAFRSERHVPKYIYQLVKRTRNKKGHYRVSVQVWKPDDDNTQYWFMFRSARNAHDAFKRIARKRR